MLDTSNIDQPNQVHIKVDSDHVQSDSNFRFAMLEQMVQSNYDDVQITRNVNEYGLLTDIWIAFSNEEDATHFRLSWQSR